MPYPWQTPAVPSGSRPWDRPDPAQLPEGQEEDQSESSWFTLPNALRVVGGIGGGIAGSFLPGAGNAAGAAIGGGLGAAAGEGLAEMLEVRRHQREHINPLQVATQGAIGAVPLGKIGSIATGALKGGMLGAGATTASHLAETGDLPELADVGKGALAGGIFGGAAAGVIGRFTRPRPVGTGQTAAAAAIAPPEGSPYRSVVSPRFQSFEPPPTSFPDAGEMAMAYQPNLPGAVKAGGRRMGGFEPSYSERSTAGVPEGSDELNAILGGEPAPQVGSKLNPTARPYPWQQPEAPADPLGFLGAADERGYNKVPFDVADDAAQRALVEQGDFSSPELRRVPIRDLVGTQPTVTRSVVENYMQQPAGHLDELPAGVHGRMADLPDVPTVVEGPDGRLYLAGGTHKTVAAQGRGESDIQALMYPRKPAAPPESDLASILPEEPAPQSSAPRFKLPEKHVPDEVFEAARARQGMEPSPLELQERRSRDVGPPPGSTDRRAARQALQDPREQHVQTPIEPAPEPPTAVRTALPPTSGRKGGPALVDVDPAAVGVDARTYQFKGGGDAAGVTDRLKAVESWDPIAGEASPLIVHERANGQQYVVDGHQRLGLAQRLKAAGRSGAPDTLRAIALRESEGVTVAHARRIGAMLNLQQGTGSATDVAKVLRERPLTSLERSRIPKDQTSGAKLRMGEDLAKLGDDAFLRVVNGQVHQNPVRNEAFGAIVGRLIPDHAEQVGALQQLAKAAPENAYQAEQFVKAIVADGFERGVQTNLFGDQEVASSLADPIARVMATARRVLQSDKSALGNALRNETRLTGQGNVLNREANQAGFESASTLDRMLDTYGHTAGPVREELKRVAAAVQTGELTPAAAANQVLAAVERERGNVGAGQPRVPADVQPNDAIGGRAPAQPPAAEAPVIPELPAVKAAPELPEATPAEVPGILQQLAKTLNVENKPLVDELPYSLNREPSKAPAAAQTDLLTSKLPASKLPASSELPAELQSLDELQTRHEVRNPEKATEIGASMKRVGWKGRPILVVETGGRRVAWTGTHRLEAAKQAGLKPADVPRVTVDGAKLAAAGYDVDELTKLGKKARIDALRKSGQEHAAQLLEEERGAKAGRQRAASSSPREKGTNPRALRRAQELLDAGDVDEAERLMSQQIEAKIKAALKRGSGGPGSTLVGGLAPFDTETFRQLVAKHPESAWKAATTAIGGATGYALDEDHPGRGVILGMLAGAAAGNIPRLVRALQTAEVRIGTPGKGVAPVRAARDPKKDIGLFELVGGTPERTIPEQFEKARPAFEKFLKALHDEHARTKEVIPQKKVQALRDRFVTPVITEIRRDAKALMADRANPQPYKAKYITAFANRLAGHRTIGQRVVQTLSKGKLPADFIERRIAGAVYYTGTGYAVDTALQNLTQPMLALGHVPFKFVAQAYKDLASSPAAKRLVEGALLPLEKPSDAIELTLGPFGRKMTAVSKALDKVDPRNLRDPQKLLRMTDQKNREIVYYAARKYAESRGLETGAADTWARQVMRKTQTEPGALGTNPFHAGPVAGSLRPFTKYPTVFTEHIIDLLKQAGEGKNLGGAARLGGTLVGLAALGRATGIDLEDLLVSGGRPLGFDIQHPQRSLKRLATGQATPASREAFDLIAHLNGTADHSLLEDAQSLAIPRYVKKLADAAGHFQDEGADAPHVTRGPGGKIRDITTPGETVLNTLGLKTTRQTERRHALTDFYDQATTEKDRYENARRQAYEDLSRAIDSEDSDAAGEAIRRIGSAQAVRQFLRERRLLPEERFYKTLPPKIRQQLRGALDETRDLAPGGR